MAENFHQRVRAVIKRIPKGKVATYGQVAALAGDPRGARQVSWVLHSSSEKDNLPWHRVINRQGKISLPKGAGYEYQRALLQDEGVVFGVGDAVDLKRYQWAPRSRRARR